MVQLVNGYACNNCADVALARRGINPAAPQRSPAATAPTAPASSAAASSAPASTAVTTTPASVPGSLSTGLQPGGTGDAQQLGSTAPRRGQILDLIA